MLERSRIRYRSSNSSSGSLQYYYFVLRNIFSRPEYFRRKCVCGSRLNKYNIKLIIIDGTDSRPYVIRRVNRVQQPWILRRREKAKLVLLLLSKRLVKRGATAAGGGRKKTRKTKTHPVMDDERTMTINTLGGGACCCKYVQEQTKNPAIYSKLLRVRLSAAFYSRWVSLTVQTHQTRAR